VEMAQAETVMTINSNNPTHKRGSGWTRPRVISKTKKGNNHANQ